MRIAERTIDLAFEAHERVHFKWPISEIIRYWGYGQDAFAQPPDPAAFRKLYEGLKGWQVFRPLKAPPTSAEVYSILANAVSRFPGVKQLKLSELTPGNLGQVGIVLDAVRYLKVNDDGPSLMAVSKFLHFLNPRLFVIVDRQFVGGFALQHEWVCHEVEAAEARTLAHGLPLDCPGSCLVSDELRYLDILLWAGGVMRDNPYITEAFADYANRRAPTELAPPDVRQYEAAAFEWLILGLVHLPPNGVQV
jgi:hypothetical protein